jgi:hypothetical protein
MGLPWDAPWRAAKQIASPVTQRFPNVFHDYYLLSPETARAKRPYSVDERYVTVKE